MLQSRNFLNICIQPTNLRVNDCVCNTWRCWLGDSNGIRPVKTEVLTVVIWLKFCIRVLFLTITTAVISCSSEIQDGLTFWYRFTQIFHRNWPQTGLLSCCDWMSKSVNFREIPAAWRGPTLLDSWNRIRFSTTKLSNNSWQSPS